MCRWKLSPLQSLYGTPLAGLGGGRPGRRGVARGGQPVDDVALRSYVACYQRLVYPLSLSVDSDEGPFSI